METAGREGQAVQPLQGIRILSIEQYGAGPYGTMHLADLGTPPSSVPGNLR